MRERWRALLKRHGGVIKEMFSSIAPRYDLLNRLLSLGLDIRWRAFAVSWVPLTVRLAVDIGTGTGDFAFTLLWRCPWGRVIGVDFSEPMLRQARRKGPPWSRERTLWVVADGLRLPLRDGVADAVLAAFTVRNFSDLQEGFQEMVRVLRDGGVALILEFCQPSPSWRWHPFGLFVRYGVPLIGGLFSDPMAYTYLTASIRTFLSPQELASKMKEAGFRRVEWVPLALGIVTFFWGVKGGGS